MNQNAVLNESVEWSFYDGSKVYTNHPKKGELLADFAKRNNTTPAYALWMNQTKASLFCTGQTIKIPVQAGCRAGSGSEIQTSSLTSISLSQGTCCRKYLRKTTLPMQKMYWKIIIRCCATAQKANTAFPARFLTNSLKKNYNTMLRFL